MGFNRLAFLAGTKPKTTPTKVEKPTAKNMASKEIPKGNPIERETKNATKIPASNPIIPPNNAKKIDSSKNCS